MIKSQYIKFQNLLIYISLIFVFIYLKSIDYLTLPSIKSASFLILAFMLLVLGFIFQAYCWHVALSLFGERVLFRQSFMSISKTIFAKYIPGKIWQITGRASYISESAGIKLSKSMKISVSAQVASMLAGMLLGIFMMVLDAKLGIYTSIDSSAVISLLGLAMPVILILAFLFRHKFNYGTFLLYTIISFAPWLFWGCGFNFLVLSLGHNIGEIAAIGTFTIAALAGILAYFFPGGIGVREGVMIILLNSFGFELDVSVGVSVVARLWFIFGEFCFFLLSFLVRGSSGKVL